MMKMISWVVMGMLLLLVSCGSSGDLMQVRTYHLRPSGSDSNGELFIRGEQQRRLYGVVTNEERAEKYGQYFTVRWREVQADGGAIRIVFEYRQANSGGKIFRKEGRFTPQDKKVTEFQVIGAAHRERGRVTSWRVSYYQGEVLRDQQRSYLWQ